MSFLRRSAAVFVLVSLCMTTGVGYLPATSLGAPSAEPCLCSGLRVDRLRTEGFLNPLGIDSVRPRFSWVTRDATNSGLTQDQYQIRVTQEPWNFSDDMVVWDSGRVVRSGSELAPFEVTYGSTGISEPLLSGTRYYWFLNVWDQFGNRNWNGVAEFQMGLLTEADWGGAQWIKASEPTKPAVAYFRKEIGVTGKIVQATLSVAGAGVALSYVNGTRAVRGMPRTYAGVGPRPGNDVLGQPIMQYDKRIGYSTYDVTWSLVSGTTSAPARNTVAIALSSGFYNPDNVLGSRGAPWVDQEKVRAILTVRLADGSVQTAVTDASWKWMLGEVKYAKNWSGEDIDHQAAAPLWSTSGFDHPGLRAVTTTALRGTPQVVASSVPAEVVTSVEAGILTSDRQVMIAQPSGPPVANRFLLYALPRNVSGLVSLTVAGLPGTQLRVQVGEGLVADGSRVNPSFNSLNSKVAPFDGGRFQQMNLTLAGTGNETFTSQFTTFAGRFIHVQVVSGDVTTPTVALLRVHNDVRPTGSFVSSDPKLTALHDAATRTYLNNLHAVPTDCPHRERLGYGADGMVAAPVGLLNFDTSAFYEKWMEDFRDAQQPNGFIPWIAPSAAPTAPAPLWYSPWWSNAAVVVPLMMYRLGGDSQILTDQYPLMQAWARYLDANVTAGRWSGAGTFPSDHEAADATDSAQMNTLAVFVAYATIAEVATILGRTNDAIAYDASAQSVRRAFNARFFSSVQRTYSRTDLSTGAAFNRATQSVLAIAIRHKLVPDTEAAGVLASLQAEIAAPNGGRATESFLGSVIPPGHMSTGIIGTPDLFRVLGDAGLNDTAYSLLTQPTHPTVFIGPSGPDGTFWERTVNAGYSHDHPAFGSVDEWLYRSVLGINIDHLVSDAEVVFRPGFVSQVNDAAGSIESPRGTVKADWVRSGLTTTYNTATPIGVSTTISLPVSTFEQITVDGALHIDRVPDPDAIGRILIKPAAIGTGIHHIVISPRATASSSVEYSGWSIRQVIDGTTTPSVLGWHSRPTTRPIGNEWLKIDLPGPRPISTITLYPARHNCGCSIGKTFGYPLSATVEVLDGAGAVVWSQPLVESSADQAARLDAPRVIAVPNVSGSSVRVTATELGGTLAGQYAFALAELTVD